MTSLPPPDREGLIRETARIVAGCVAFIVVLGTVVYLLTG
jgi:hypothetical protein